MSEETIKKQMENLDSELFQYKMRLRRLSGHVSYYSDKENRIGLSYNKSIAINSSKEELSMLSKRDIVDLFWRISSHIEKCKEYLDELSKINIADIYILTSRLNFERYNLFRKVKKENPHLPDEFISQKISYPGIEKIDKDLIDMVKEMKENKKNMKDMVKELESLNKKATSVLYQKNKEEIMTCQPLINNGEFAAVYLKENCEGRLSSEFIGITTKQEFDFLREKEIAFKDVSIHNYTTDHDKKYELQEPKTLEELNLVAKYLKELQQLKEKTYKEENGILRFGESSESFAAEITKRELLERGFYYSFENWSFVEKLRNKDNVVEVESEERKVRNI